MRARSSATISGGRCRKRQRWCRESRSGWIFCARGAREVPAEMSRASSRKKNFLFRKRKSENRNWHMGAAVAAPFFYRAAHSMRDAGTSADPATAENDILADDDAVLFRVNREDIDRLAGGEAKALALADCKVVNSVVAPNYVAVFVDDFTFAILQRDSALT